MSPEQDYLKATQVNAFTRGSQIFMHSLRMCIQGTKASCMVSAILIGSFVLLRCVQKLQLVDIYYFLVESFACLKLDIGSIFYPGQEISISFYRFSKKAWVKGSALKFKTIFWKYDNGQRLLSFAKWVVMDALAEISLVFVIGLLFSYGFFIYQGRRSIVKSKVRGADMVSPKELTSMLKTAKQASSITLAGMPIVKGSQRQHMLITGTTGTGKTNMLNELLPQIRKRGEKAIIVDVTGFFVQLYFNPKTDILLNPFDARSSNWLPWADCSDICDYDKLAAALCGQAGLSESFWETSAAKIIAEAFRKTKNEKNIDKVLEIFNTYSLKEYGDFFKNSKVAAMTDPQGEKTTLSIRTTISNKTEILSNLQNCDHPFSIKNYVLDQSNTGLAVFKRNASATRNFSATYLNSNRNCH